MMSSAHFLLEGSFLPTWAEPYRWGWLGLSSLLGLVVGDSGLFQAFVLLGPRLSTLIMAMVPIFSTFLGWLFFRETVTGVELTGILLTVGGVAWVVSEKRSNRTVVENKQYGWGIFFGLVGALGQASGLIAALWSIASLRGRVGFTLKQWRNKTAFAAILFGAMIGPFIGVWFSLTAIQLARIGIASTLMALTPIILIPLSYFILKERISLRAVAGTIVALTGVALIFL
jgi:drug/metabolite transporter (DMT)-like permease